MLAGAGYGGGDICVGDSGGSDILVVILVVDVLAEVEKIFFFLSSRHDYVIFSATFKKF